MKKTLKIILLSICFIVFAISLYKICSYVIETSKNRKANQELIKKVITETQYTDKEEKIPISVDFEILKKENSDIVGWIYSNDTVINYPVVQSKDNEYYLRRMINKQYNIEGSIFMDYRNKSNMTDNNTILYGHNMNNGNMFGSITKYKKQNYYEGHKELYYITQEVSYKVKLIAGYTTNINADIYNLVNVNKENLAEIIKKSDFKSDVVVKEKDKFLTLSTCTNRQEDERYVLIGILE